MNLGGQVGGNVMHQQGLFQDQFQQHQLLLQQLAVGQQFGQGGLFFQQPHQQPHQSPPTPRAMHITGKQFLVWCNGDVRQCDTKDEAEAIAGTLAHQHQSDAFVLAPVLRVAPKRDVVTTPISL